MEEMNRDFDLGKNKMQASLGMDAVEYRIDVACRRIHVSPGG